MTYALNCFGGFFLCDRDRVPVTLRGRRADALFVYLALEGERPVPRRLLAELLWPERASDGGQGALRQAVHVIRKATTPCLLKTDGDSLSLSPGKVETDLDRLCNETSAFQVARALRDRIGGGGFLAGFRQAGAAHGAWIQQKRAFAEQKAAEALGRLAERDAAEGKLFDASLSARARVALDPLSEAAVRALAEIQIAMGEPAAANRTVQVYKRRLSEEAPEAGGPSPDLLNILRGKGETQTTASEPEEALLPTLALAVVLSESAEDAGTKAVLLADHLKSLGAHNVSRRLTTVTAIFGETGLRASAVGAAFRAARALRSMIPDEGGISLTLVRVTCGGNGAVRLGETDRARAILMAAEADAGEIRVAEEVPSLSGAEDFRFQRGAGGALNLAADASRIDARPFVGRVAERAQILAASEAVREGGTARLLTVQGAPGIGKSRLIAEALKDQAFVSVDRFALLPGPLGAADVIEPLLAVLGVVQRRSSPEDDLAPRASSLVDRAAQAIERRPDAIALVIEDVETAAPEELLLLVDLIERVSDCPVLWLLAVRTEALAAPAALEKLAGRLPVSTLTLGPLTASEAHEIASGHDLSEAVRADCVERATGNPLFLQQLLLQRTEGAEDVVPASIQEAVLGRFAALETTAMAALRLAAVLGDGAPEEAILQIGAVGAEVLQNLAESRLICREGGTVRVEHGLIRDAVLSAMKKDVLAALHTRAASWFESSDPVRHARHLLAAGDRRAARASLVAAGSERKAGRHAGAAELASVGAERAGSRALRSALKLEEARACTVLGALDRAEAAFDTAERATLDRAARADALIGLANIARLRDRSTPGLSWLAEAEGLIEAGDLARRARLLVTRGRLHYSSGAIADSRNAYAAALDAARAGGFDALEVEALGGLADAAYAAGDMVSADRQAAAAIAVCSNVGLKALETIQWSFRAHVMVYNGRLDVGRATAEKTAIEAERLSDWRAEINAFLGVASAAFCQDDLATCMAAAERVGSLALHAGARRFELVAGLYRARIAIAEGKTGDARHILDGLRTIVEETHELNHGAQVEILAAFAAPSRQVSMEHIASAEALLEEGAFAHNGLRVLPNAALLWHKYGEIEHALSSIAALTKLADNDSGNWASLHANAIGALLSEDKGKPRALAEAARLCGFRRLALACLRPEQAIGSLLIC
jgi:DNA-binding SARP family transcriptional activator